MNLTPKQLRVLDFIRERRENHGYSPTMQEIADFIGVSKVTVFEHVEALVSKGALLRDPNKARSLSLPDEDRSELAFALVGRIAAGHPIEKFEQSEELHLGEIFGPRRGRHGEMFALQVEGESMRDEGIFDGDFVIIEKRDTARDGERVVAILPDGESTLKTLFRQPDGTIRLQPANPAFDPIVVRECRIQGVVIGVLRRY
jgi:repressor LexA